MIDFSSALYIAQRRLHVAAFIAGRNMLGRHHAKQVAIHLDEHARA
jgi:hypothetical protein